MIRSLAVSSAITTYLMRIDISKRSSTTKLMS
jgi:hypothetical protein